MYVSSFTVEIEEEGMEFQRGIFKYQGTKGDAKEESPLLGGGGETSMV